MFHWPPIMRKSRYATVPPEIPGLPPAQLAALAGEDPHRFAPAELTLHRFEALNRSAYCCAGESIRRRVR